MLIHNTSVSHGGAFSSYTELGPPDKIIPAGSSLRISSSEVVHGKIAENTPCSLTRRAISCVYCPPKSSTTIPPCSARNGGTAFCACRSSAQPLPRASPSFSTFHPSLHFRVLLSLTRCGRGIYFVLLSGAFGGEGSHPLPLASQ